MIYELDELPLLSKPRYGVMRKSLMKSHLTPTRPLTPSLPTKRCLHCWCLQWCGLWCEFPADLAKSAEDGGMGRITRGDASPEPAWRG